MTINDTSQSADIQIDAISEPSHVDVASQEIQARVESLVQRMEESYTAIFGADHIPNLQYYQQLKERISGVNEKFNIDVLLDNSKDEVKFYVKKYLKELNDLSLDEWPLAYQTAKDQIRRIKERGVFANIEFRGYFGFEDTLAFEEYESRAQKALGNAKEKLAKLSDYKERNDLIHKVLADIRDVREDVELHIAKFSIPDTKDKIINRIEDIITEFDDLDLSEEEDKVQTIESQTKGLLKDKDKKGQMDVIASQLDRLQEVDTEIEKKYFIRVIQKKYEELIDVVMKLQVDGLSLSSEMRYAKSRVEGSKERIRGIITEASPTSLNYVSQLQITKKGTMNTLAHTLKEVYVKYGAHTIATAIQLLPFCARLGGLEGIGAEEKKALALHREKLVQQAKTDLTWGDEGKNSKVPPILPEEKIEEIIDKHLEQASKSIYLAYAEQRIRKYLKFWMLRKSFEGYSSEQKKLILKQANELIDQAKDELLLYLNEQTPPRVSIGDTDAKVTGEFKVDEIKVEKIITDYILKLNAICLS